MLTRIDHVMICVPSLEQGIDAYTRIGFNVYPGRRPPGQGTHNAIAFHGEDYLELMSVSDRDEYLAARRPPAARAASLGFPRSRRRVPLRHRAERRPGGRRGGDAAARRRRERPRPRRAPDARPGRSCGGRSAALGRRNPLPVLFIQHLTPLDERRAQVPRAGAASQRRASRRPRVHRGSRRRGGGREIYAGCSGCPCPRSSGARSSRPTWRCSTSGRPGLTVAQPAEPGPAAEALARRGPGPFQVLYRTSSMDAAARWMADHGVPPPARGIRNTGEQAMLVAPEHACGAYIGFARAGVTRI